MIIRVLALKRIGRKPLNLSANGVTSKIPPRSKSQIGAYSSETSIPDRLGFKALMRVVPNTARPNPVPTTPKYMIIRGHVRRSEMTLTTSLQPQLSLMKPPNQGEANKNGDRPIDDKKPFPALHVSGHIHLLEACSNQSSGGSTQLGSSEIVANSAGCAVFWIPQRDVVCHARPHACSGHTGEETDGNEATCVLQSGITRVEQTNTDHHSAEPDLRRHFGHG
ncbi:hypothetical protein OGATHE_006710 [Ogataea polymorpha]|uniref:Uncharacterized protein n=1 Tax=Ogataea polymorpha TaxID=460523 RepID=A0A9P8SYC3_9ASCO|nr:hypothetical protein OGATHE_006710 [Ogataea polymorpha]